MNNNVNRAKESFSGPSKRPDIKSAADSKEVQAAAEIGKAAYVEAMGMDESIETTGRISEVLSDTRDQQGDGAGGAKAKKDDAVIDPEELKARLLKAMPHERVMRRQIEREIKNEIHYLHKKAMSMIRSPKEMNYFEMNNIVSKIRELRKLLKNLIKASMDAMKGLWLRYVHGIM